VTTSLCRELDRVYRVFTGETSADVSGEAAVEETSPVKFLSRTFELSAFERDVLLLSAGVELESRFALACAEAQKDPRLIAPTFGMALASLDAPHWSAVNRDAPLRYWRLVDLGPGGLTRAPLRIDERILHYLTGLPCGDDRISPFLSALDAEGGVLAEIHRPPAETAASRWARTGEPVLLTSRRASERRAVVQEMCRLLGRPCFSMRASDIPVNAAEREQVARLWTREHLLTGAVLCVNAAEFDDSCLPALCAFVERAAGIAAIEAREQPASEQTGTFRLAIPAIGASERKAVWIESLGPDAYALNGRLDRIVDHFEMDGPSIRLAGDIVRNAPAADDRGPVAWQACRELSRRSLDGLAQRIDAKARWQDVVLPEPQLDTLRQIVAHVRQRATVHRDWGFGGRYARGLAVTALFAGASGTGKTMAAEAIAADLDLDLYQIDLAGVVSKYIGETEKNLRRIFDAAEDSGAVLLFDEADALFGKRSDVRDSHDRYANVEVSYLLQRMDSYRGLAILTTNMKHAIDAAFVRRLRFIVQFPFPGAPERRRIWENVFPVEAPARQLDYERLSQLNVAGGVIRNIAMHAAFLAADEGGEIGMNHILRAARVEYGKMDRPLTAAETGGSRWS
jgi:hypothetical protein